METITRYEARKMMKSFSNKYNGKVVWFNKLNDYEKLVFVMIKSFNFFDFLKPDERIDRCIRNSLSHKESEFKNWIENDSLAI